MSQEKERFEIEAIRLISAIYKKIGLIIVSGALCGALMTGLTHFFISPKYESTATMLVITNETTMVSLTDLQTGSQLTKDCALLISSKPVLQKVIDNLELDTTYKELKELVTVEYLDDSRLLTITTVQKGAELAKSVVDELASVSSDYIGEQMEITPPKIIEVGEVPESKSSPDIVKNIVLGILAGMLLACIIICVYEIMNDFVQTEEDIEKYIGGSVLAVIPNVGTIKRDKKRKKKARKR